VNYTKNDPIKVIMEEIHESDFTNKIRTTLGNLLSVRGKPFLVRLWSGLLKPKFKISGRST